MNIPKVTLRVVGVVSIALALLGFFYNGTTITADFSQLQNEHDIPFFYPAFYVMSAVCLTCFVLLLVFGIKFFQLKPQAVPLFVLLLVFEVLYFLAIGPMWLLPSIGGSIAAASGVANGGLMFQAFILFPIWSIPASLWARRRLSDPRLEPSPAYTQ